MLAEIDKRGVLATPGDSWINELVTEAARLSIAHGGRSALIEYEPTPKVRLRTWMAQEGAKLSSGLGTVSRYLL